MQQMPPPFSAKKIAGVPAYKLARKKQEVELKPCKSRSRSLRFWKWLAIVPLSGPTWAPEPICVRSPTIWDSEWDAALTLASATHSGGRFNRRRPHVGEFGLGCAAGNDRGDIYSSSRVAPAHAVCDCDGRIRRLNPTGRAVNLPEMSRAPRVKVFHGQRELIAIASRIAGTLFHPSIVLTAGD